MKKLGNEYFIYGLLVPYSWYTEWNGKNNANFEERFSDYLNDNPTKEVICCMFYNRGGKFFIIGKVLDVVNTDNPIIVPEINDMEKYLVNATLKMVFNLEGELHYYFVKKQLFIDL